MGKFGDFLSKAGGFIAGVTGIGQSFIDSRTAKRNTDMTIRENRRMADLAYSRDLEMWNRTNEYNSPEMQMERLRAAGLNPNLVYGGGGALGNTSPASMPKYNAPTAQYNYRPLVDLPVSISAYQDMLVKQAQYDNLKAQRDVINEEATQKKFLNTFASKTMDWRTQAEYQKLYNLGETGSLLSQKKENILEMFPHQLEFAKGRTRYQSNQVEKMIQDMKKSEASTEFTKLQNEWYVTKMISQFGLGVINSLSKFAPWRGAAKAVGDSYKKSGHRLGDFNRTTRDIYRGRFND